jgi:hypothetical protein
MKQLLAALTAFALVSLAAAPVSANGPLGSVDLSNAAVSPDTSGAATGTHGSCSSFSDERAGYWGNEYGSGAVTAYPGDTDPAGYCTFTGLTAKARHISLRVLDGIADDSFDVYVKNPGGNWALVFGYTANPSTVETWIEHDINGFPAGKGQGNEVEMKIVPRNVGWSGFATWGQLAVDWVKIWEH